MRTPLAGFLLLTAVSGSLLGEIVQWRVVDGGNGHYYEFVSTGLLWTEAIAEAASRSHLGHPGHLATITSRAEQEFLNSIKPYTGDAWLGGSDLVAEGVWRWVVGPEQGELLSAHFLNWAPGNPDNWQDEDYLIGWWREGDGDDWNDGGNNRYRGYVVEFSVPPNPLQMLMVTVEDGNLSVNFNTSSNVIYTVQANQDLATTNWVDFTDIVGNGLIVQTNLPIDLEVPQRFFRIKEQ